MATTIGYSRRPTVLLFSDEYHGQLIFIHQPVTQIESQQRCQRRRAFGQDRVCLPENGILSPVWSAIWSGQKPGDSVIFIQIGSPVDAIHATAAQRSAIT